MKKFETFGKVVGVAIDLMLALLIGVVLIAMAESIYHIFVSVVPLSSLNDLYIVIEEIATWFILLEIILMLLRYVQEGHHVPVRYLLLIGITAISRKLLLEHGEGKEALLLALAILVLVINLILLERVRSFHAHHDGPEEHD